MGGEVKDGGKMRREGGVGMEGKEEMRERRKELRRGLTRCDMICFLLVF